MTNDEDNCIDENTCENFSNARERVTKETHCNLFRFRILQNRRER